MSSDPSVRRILPQQPSHDPQDLQDPQMSSYQFAHMQPPQRETQKSAQLPRLSCACCVMCCDADSLQTMSLSMSITAINGSRVCARSPSASRAAKGHMLTCLLLTLVMRACEGCRRRKIKCDAATTNTWPCSACIRLKLHCVKPNGFDGAADAINYDPPITSAGGQFQLQQTLAPDSAASFSTQGFHDASPTGYHTLGYDTTQAQSNLNYTSVPPPVSLVEQQYSQRAVFPTPPLQSGGLDEPSPEAYSPDSAHQHDLADLLGTLKMDETGTGMIFGEVSM
jgi:hypothetical protein